MYECMQSVQSVMNDVKPLLHTRHSIVGANVLVFRNIKVPENLKKHCEYCAIIYKNFPTPT